MDQSPKQPPLSPAQYSSRALSLSPRKQYPSSPSREASSAQLRRRIGDLNNKCDSLETKYCDLRELVVKEAERNFDRLQKQSEERARALHFKLCVQNEVASESYEEAQFTYMPQLDESRDRELINLLPEFLTDEITFPRPQAAKFYARVSKSLMEPPE
ncbi:hypothetical protein ACHAQF_006445 [Verticillium nonalfalfae]